MDRDNDGQMDFVDPDTQPSDPTNIDAEEEPHLPIKIYLPFISK